MIGVAKSQHHGIGSDVDTSCTFSEGSNQEHIETNTEKARRKRAGDEVDWDLSDLPPLGSRITFHSSGDALLSEATVAFVGFTTLAAGIWLGVILDAPSATACDGSVEGRSYFRCAPLHGLFIRPEAVVSVTPVAGSQRDDEFLALQLQLSAVTDLLSASLKAKARADVLADINKMKRQLEEDEAKKIKSELEEERCRALAQEKELVELRKRVMLMKHAPFHEDALPENEGGMFWSVTRIFSCGAGGRG